MADSDSVRQRWHDVNKEIGVSEVVAERWWGVVRDLYSDPARHYHTLQHLREMFQHFDFAGGHITFCYPRLVTLAVFFHDIIYEPKKPDNEERSADKFEEYAAEVNVLSDVDCKKVKDWILLTKSHTALKGDNSGDEHYFLDIDMAVLGRPVADYDEYANQIRAEYIHVPEEIYRSKRAQILEDFLTRLPLFSTKLFQKQFEDRAKTNLIREIGRLRDNSIPL
ncbi:uncharacterized protein LOC110463289 [Mizuhopecten yessoensis]|uniref:Uncharacterized protein n=1 Tax=Mizuhopecten yessoensis TaxID=6573 RepID=A0A210PWH6_MIZYE|nr:uncharacterized protein LOC110463289 [Mizuhopecten yessoensis]OWF40816.1 hypothetical protein KP79_PYT09220 [Mizuhopecten yessoensis]